MLLEAPGIARTFVGERRIHFSQTKIDIYDGVYSFEIRLWANGWRLGDGESMLVLRESIFEVALLNMNTTKPIQHSGEREAIFEIFWVSGADARVVVPD